MGKLAERRLLIVDPHEDTLELLTFALKREGATIVTATSALDALRVLSEVQVHGLVCEIVLPDMDGCQLLYHLQANTPKGWKLPPAIAVTGFISDVMWKSAYSAGYAGYLSKPVDLDQLVLIISTLT